MQPSSTCHSHMAGTTGQSQPMDMGVPHMQQLGQALQRLLCKQTHGSHQGLCKPLVGCSGTHLLPLKPRNLSHASAAAASPLLLHLHLLLLLAVVVVVVLAVVWLLLPALGLGQGVGSGSQRSMGHADAAPLTYL